MPGLLARFSQPLIAQLFSDHRVGLMHNVEALLYRSDDPVKPVGRLWESRWSNGLSSFTLRLDQVPEEHDGTARLYNDGTLVAGFDFCGRKLVYRWLGKRTDEVPGFDPGQEVRVEVAGMEVRGTVTSH